MKPSPHAPSPQGEGVRRTDEGENVDLYEAHSINETTHHRNVGLVIETRPDEINPMRFAGFVISA